MDQASEIWADAVKATGIWMAPYAEQVAELGRLIIPRIRDVIESAREEGYRARLQHALAVPEVWSQAERDGMAAAFAEADGKHGHYETLFAVAAWLLRHRASTAA